jgi:hypothetical protein
MATEDAPTLEGETPPVAPPAAPTIGVADLAAAIRSAVSDIIPGLVQHQAPAPRAAAPYIPNNPIDLLSQAEQAKLADIAIGDPALYGRHMAELGARHAQMRFEAAARPYQDTNARLLVSDFRNRMQQTEAPDDFRQISPAFDKLLAALDLTPLVSMSEQDRSGELILRWNAAKCEVLDAARKKQAAIKPDPTLLASGSSLSSPAGGGKTLAPWLERMNSSYKFTPEQLKQIAGEE